VPDAAVNLSTVCLQLSSPGPRCRFAAELRHFHAAPGQPRKHVFELCQFHLQLAFTRAGVAREDIENSCVRSMTARVDHTRQYCAVAKARVVIEQNHIAETEPAAPAISSACLADQSAGSGRSRALLEFAGDLRTRAHMPATQFV